MVDRMPARKRVTRSHVVAMARLHHVLWSFSGLWFSGARPLGQLLGTAGSGGYLSDDGSGDRLHLVWTAHAIVGVVFDHESERSQYAIDRRERDPLASLHGLPPVLASLARRAAKGLEDLVTAGLWAADDESGVSFSDRDAVHGLEHFAGFLLDEEEALFGDHLTQNWLELSSLSEAQGRLAVRLARAAANGPVSLGKHDEEILVTPPPDRDGPLDPAVAKAVRGALLEAGITWKVPLARIRADIAKARATNDARVSAALSADARALFDAARANDAVGVARGASAGVDLDVRTIEGQWDHTPAGDTPLIQACKAASADAALALLRAGADPNAANSFGQSALVWAVRAKLVEVARECLARGADPNLAERDGTSALHHAAADGASELVELLLAKGASTTAKRWNGYTPAEMARVRGHTSLAKRLL
jgi:hypothetical protein